jgi:two-component system, LytTR family, sensor kinase
MQAALSIGDEKTRSMGDFTLREYMSQLPVAMSWWTAMVFLEAAQVLLFDARRGYILPLTHYFVWPAFEWYSWALLTPLILAVARRYPITKSNWVQRILFPHALMAVACICLQAVLRGVVGSIYSVFETPASPFALMRESFDKRGLENITAYCLVVATAAYLHLREEVRLRQVRQAQLEARLASAKLEMLRMQLQPHFLFNTLQAAITLVQEDPRAAEDMLLRLSQLLRITLDEVGNHQIPLSREFDLLDLYVGIQRVRFSERLTVEIHAAPNTLDSLVPTLLLQPLVENAIRHGIGKHKGDDVIEINARLANGGIELEVWNRNSVVDDTTERLLLRGVGLRNTKARLEQLYGPTSTLILRSLGNRGAVVLIFIPARFGPERTARDSHPIRVTEVAQ